MQSFDLESRPIRSAEAGSGHDQTGLAEARRPTSGRSRGSPGASTRSARCGERFVERGHEDDEIDGGASGGCAREGDLDDGGFAERYRAEPDGGPRARPAARPAGAAAARASSGATAEAGLRAALRRGARKRTCSRRVARRYWRQRTRDEPAARGCASCGRSCCGAASRRRSCTSGCGRCGRGGRTPSRGWSPFRRRRRDAGTATRERRETPRRAT